MDDKFLSRFWSLCKNTGVIDQLVEKGLLLDEGHFNDKAIPYIKEEIPIDDEFVQTYRRMFSKENIKISGKTGDYNCVKKYLYKFMMVFGFDKETILQATRNYLRDYKSKPTYIMNADYFIRKEDTGKVARSHLAGYCEEVGVIEEEIRTWSQEM
jgi:hypothetical protein